MNNPEYVPNTRGRPIATRCRICGGQLTHPLEARKGFHDKCLKNYKSKTYGVK